MLAPSCRSSSRPVCNFHAIYGRPGCTLRSWSIPSCVLWHSTHKRAQSRAGLTLDLTIAFVSLKSAQIYPLNHKINPLFSIITPGNMPVAPITGRLRRRIWTDLGTALGLGTSSAYAYWYVLSSLSPSLLSFTILSQFRYFYYIPTGKSTTPHGPRIVIMRSMDRIFIVYVAYKAAERSSSHVESSRKRTGLAHVPIHLKSFIRQ